MLSRRDTEVLRALERQDEPSTGADIGRLLMDIGLASEPEAGHKALDNLRTRGLTEAQGDRPQRWELTKRGRETIGRIQKTLEHVLCEFGVRTIPLTEKRGPLETHAVRTFQKMWERLGEAHVREVLAIIVESSCDQNKMALNHPVISAVSDLLVAHRDWYETDPSRWLAVFDRIDLVALWEFTKANQRAVTVPQGVSAMLFAELASEFEPGAYKFRLESLQVARVAPNVAQAEFELLG